MTMYRSGGFGYVRLSIAWPVNVEACLYGCVYLDVDCDKIEFRGDRYLQMDAR